MGQPAAAEQRFVLNTIQTINNLPTEFTYDVRICETSILQLAGKTCKIDRKWDIVS